MRFREAIPLRQLAELTGTAIKGDPDALVLGLNEIHRIEEGELVFVDHPKYYDKALNSAATFVLINKEVDAPAGKALLVSEKPFDDFNKIIRHYFSNPLNLKRLGENTTISADAVIHETAVIGNNVRIDAGTVIHPNVTIYDDVHIGKDCVIHANVVLGSHAFYYKKKPSGFDPLVTCGRLIIHDRVDIGANSTVDKGVTADTIIGEGTKIDNLVHIAHDTVVGKNCLFASQVGIAGCVTVEDDVTMWGQVGVASGITIGKGAVLLAKSGVGKSVEGGKAYFGAPAEDARVKMKELALLKRIPDLLDFMREQKK